MARSWWSEENTRARGRGEPCTGRDTKSRSEGIANTTRDAKTRRNTKNLCQVSDINVLQNRNMSKTLTVRLEDDVAEALEREARRTNRSKGRVVRDALKDHLNKGRRSALEALKKYAGIIEGPEDLSTNKKYLAGLGKPRRP